MSGTDGIESQQASAAHPGDGIPSPIRGGPRNILAGFRHIRGAMSGGVKLRVFDNVTIGLVALSVLALSLAVIFNLSPFLRILPLVLVSVVLILYIMNRIGIFLSVAPRQAILFWQLILGAFWLGIITCLMAIVIGLYFSE